MTSIPQSPRLASRLESLLGGLRRRIRLYVLVEGLALATAWLGLTYWIALAADYLPVLLGASDVPPWARGVGLALVGAVLAWILYRWILRRLFVRLSDHSMAILLERRHRRFRDSLLTAVEMSEHPAHASQFSPEMLHHTGAEALALSGDVRLLRVFRFFPLWRNVLAASLLAASVLLFALLPPTREAFSLSLRRLYLLSEDTWPRWAHIEVVGLEVYRLEFDSAPDSQPAGQRNGAPRKKRRLIPFEGRTLKVAKGAGPTLVVRADVTYKTPDYCVATFRSRHDRTRAEMPPTGSPAEGYQLYTFGREPLKSIRDSLDFDVRGLDHRVGGYRIEVVESPTVIKTELACRYPDYLVDRRRSLYLSRTIPWTPGVRLERGTRVTILGKANNDLKTVYIYDAQLDKTAVLDVAGADRPSRSFQYTIPSLDRNVVLEIYLVDANDQITRQPARVTIGMIDDEVPKVEVALKGIGTAVTPVARIPAAGRITDDHRIDRAWFQLDRSRSDPSKPGGTGSREFPIDLAAGGKVAAAVDLRQERNRQENKLELVPGDKLALTIMAVDRYNLEPGPHIGSGDRYRLSVVTPEALLIILEARELDLRRRFEQIYAEMTQTRDSLLRVKSASRPDGGTDAGAEPEDVLKKETPPGTEPEDAAKDTAEDATAGAAERAAALQLLRVQRAGQQSQKAAGEVYSVAVLFEDIREELINNRVDTEERKIRLKEQIAEPLKTVAREMFPELDRRLAELEKSLGNPATEGDTANLACEQADKILIAMDTVLQKMLDLETFNELVDLLRELIDDHSQVIEETKREKKKEELKTLGGALK